MTRRGNFYAAVLPVLIAGLLALPAAAWAAGSGGGGLGPGANGSPTSTGAPLGSGSPPNPPVKAGNVVVSASGGGMTIASRASALLRTTLRFNGNVPAGDAGDIVQIERMGRQTGWTWALTAQARVASDGSFAATWATNHIGQFSIRAAVAGPQGAARASAMDTSPTVMVTVYRPSVASQYGPGFYGHRTACGQVLRRTTVGVAHRTLPCGTPVAVYYAGRTMIVPVIDRGPYVDGVDWDLTTATAQALAIPGTATIGAVSLPSGAH